MADIRETLVRVATNGGEDFIRARDKKHAESMRVSAFNIKRKMPVGLSDAIGIQAMSENDLHFLRIFDRKIDGAQHWKRNEVGILVPTEDVDQDNERMIALMRKDGKSEEEITLALGS